MRTRRRFQPSLDGMPIRIAPSSMGIGLPVVGLVATPPPSTGGTQLPALTCSIDPTEPTEPPA